MALLGEEDSGPVRKIIQLGWKFVFGMLFGGLAVFLTMCSKIGGVN